MCFSEIKVKEIKRLVSLGPWHLPFRTLDVKGAVALKGAALEGGQ